MAEDTRLRVEVFPVEPDRWISLIDAPGGAFSSEVARAKDVSADVGSSIRGVLGDGYSWFLVDDLGQGWSPVGAPAQLTRLGVRWRPERRSWVRRLVTRRDPWRGACPGCGHDWREHLPSDGSCSECRYEIEHQEPEAPTAACTLLPPPH